MKAHYCSACYKPCKIVLRDDSFGHAFGTERVFTPAPACHPDDDLLTREEWADEVGFRWRVRKAKCELTEANKRDIFREILSQYVQHTAVKVG